MKLNAVPDWPSSLIARRVWGGVLLRFDLRFGEDAWLDEGEAVSSTERA